MKTTKYLVSTLKETPSSAEIASHQLMLRSGLIRKVASGIYSWLPTGIKVLKKVEQIIREEMDKIDANEIIMPILQPASLWEESGRFNQYGAELVKLKDRNKRDFVLGPTHEEVITSLIKTEITSYKQLPISLYQIQTKFRDEVRPRFGVMRSREFLMKDAYSFHENPASMEMTYKEMSEAYKNIFNRLSLKYKMVQADSGAIGGSVSHEFHALAQAGEDTIAYSSEGDYAANIELATSITNRKSTEAPLPISKLHTPNASTIKDLAEHHDINPDKTIKTLIVKASPQAKSDFIAILLNGEDELNHIKAENHELIASPIEYASTEEINQLGNTITGYIGPKDLDIPIIADKEVQHMINFTIGANEQDHHYINANWNTDLPLPQIFDFRQVQENETSPDGKGVLQFTKGIEIGHIFQLGCKYSEKLNAKVLDQNGKNKELHMGCYGIGVTRLVAAIIEQNHDEHGITWPESINPFQVAIAPLNMHKSEAIKEKAELIYNKLKQHNIDVILDDRKERPGVMLKDMELIGCPYIIILGDKNINDDELEIKVRKTKDKIKLNIDSLISKILNKQ